MNVDIGARSLHLVCAQNVIIPLLPSGSFTINSSSQGINVVISDDHLLNLAVLSLILVKIVRYL